MRNKIYDIAVAYHIAPTIKSFIQQYQKWIFLTSPLLQSVTHAVLITPHIFVADGRKVSYTAT